MTHPFSLVDVFAEAPFSGNPLAVITGAAGLDSAQMLAITQWLNLSETSFLLPPENPEADYRVRIFTPLRELPFAGRPTLGTCHVWLESGGVPKRPDVVVQDCAAGLIKVKRMGERLAFAGPPLRRSGPLAEQLLARICAILRIDPADVVDHNWGENGPGWAMLLLKSDTAVRDVMPQPDVADAIAAGAFDVEGFEGHAEIGLVGLCAAGGDFAYEVRGLFTNQHGALVEDPVTGSLNAAVAQWLIGSGRAAPPYVAAQGSCVGRAGRIRITQDDEGAIWVGGAYKTLMRRDARF